MDSVVIDLEHDGLFIAYGQFYFLNACVELAGRYNLELRNLHSSGKQLRLLHRTGERHMAGDGAIERQLLHILGL